MSDLFDQVTSDQDIFKKLLSKVPGFKGYIERENRRSSDKLLRGMVAERYEEQWGRISGLQRDLISEGGLVYIDDLESAAIKLRQFIDRVKTATYGYAGLFDAVKVREDELQKMYQYDLSLLDGAEEVKRAVDNVEASMGSEGLPASIRHLTSLAQNMVELFNRRAEVITQGEEPAA
ncbi:hypothetical protein ADN00_15280 [Ornatilinea apprima]|uniref:Uncharacterized protein n=1 Tax=Ornatilinea apprima TaxID=1134406 RepID=A0A0P6XBR1_9CHLR|nr:hypothetical protein [Ornatilinea apprima]KPL72192.1 hypothetical protein ADN00_15280 [Ornatilinea apprima]